MALVGDNGAGKSTLIKCVAGHPRASTRARSLVRRRAGLHPAARRTRRKLGIEVVYQDLALCDNLDVVQNMYLGREAHDWLRGSEGAGDGGEDARDARRASRVTTIRSIRQPVATLSGGQRQSVAVARAVMWNSRLVILDEPTAALGVAQTEQVLELVDRLAEQGLAVVLISHNLHDIFEVARRGSPSCGSAATSASTSATKTRSRRSCTRSRPACRRRSPGIASTYAGSAS